MKDKWEKMGKQGAKRTEVCSIQRRDTFESRIFLGCKMATKKVFRKKKKIRFHKLSLCMSFHHVSKFIVLMFKHRDSNGLHKNPFRARVISFIFSYSKHYEQ